MVARSVVRSMFIFFLGCVVCCAEGKVLVGEAEVPQGEAEGDTVETEVPLGEKVRGGVLQGED